MAQPALPPELHRPIIDFIGHDVVNAEQVMRGVKSKTRETLRACSLVCKAWHHSALRYIFHNARISMVAGDRGLERNTELFRLIEANPSIRRCIRSAKMYLEREVSPADVEKVCNAISTVEEFSLALQSPRPNLLRPSLDGLRPILSSQHLRDMTIWSSHIPLRLVEDAPNLRSVSLPIANTVDMDHGRDGTWRSSSQLEKLVVKHGQRILNQIQTWGERYVGLLAFFDHLKYLEMDLYADRVDHGSSWALLLSHWRRLETLAVRWIVSCTSISIRRFTF